jgi:hypothetical protein
MAYGALGQLIATGRQNISMNLQNYNSAEVYIHIDSRENIGFNKNISFLMSRDGDTLKEFLFNIKMNPAPQGWHYKQCWYTHFFKHITLEIGGQRIFSINSEMLQMEQLIHGESGPKELTFNYPTINERIEKSRNSHEVIVEPLKLSKLIHSKIIRLICLAFCEVRITVQTGSLDDILEQDGTAVHIPIQEPHDAFIQSFTLNGLYQLLDTQPRRTMNQNPHTDIIKQNYYNIVEASTNQRTNLILNSGGLCSALYIWITDQNNREIPNQLISNIKIKLNGRERINSSGFHCRHINKRNLPFPTIDNDKSQNLYYISYFSGLNSENGAENGLNLSRIDNYTCEIEWVNNIHMNVKIHIVHRTNNIFRTERGMCEVMYSGIAGNVAVNNAIRNPPNVVPNAIQGIEFENTEQLINIHCDEICMLTQDKFEEGTMVDYCNQCKKAFTTELLAQWMANKTYKKCAHCRNPYRINTFKRGKIHLVNEEPEQLIVNPPNNGEPEQLIVNPPNNGDGIGFILTNLFR